MTVYKKVIFIYIFQITYLQIQQWNYYHLLNITSQFYGIQFTVKWNFVQYFLSFYKDRIDVPYSFIKHIHVRRIKFYSCDTSF